MTSRWSTQILTAALALLVACASGQGAQKIDESRLAGIPQDQMQPVQQARSDIDQAKEDQLAAKQGKMEADSRVKMAKTELDVANAQLDQVKTQYDIQQKNQQSRAEAPYNAPLPGSPDANVHPPTPTGPTHIVTPEAFQQARLQVETAKAKVAYLQKLADIAGTDQKVADRRLDLANAKLEQSRYQVLAKSNPAEVDAMKVTAPQYDAEVAKRQADLASVEADRARQRTEARDQYKTWSKLDNELSQFSNENLREAEVPPPPRG